MVRVIMDDTGSGKTKQLIDLANAAVKTEHGNVICIEPKSELTYDIDYNIRLIAANDYELPSYEAFKGFLSGMYAGNYDITHVFVDNLTKIIRDNNETQVNGSWIGWMRSARRIGSNSPSPCPLRRIGQRTVSPSIPDSSP